MSGLVVRLESVVDSPRPFHLESDPAWWDGVRAAFHVRPGDATLVRLFTADFEGYRLGARLLFRGKVTGTVRFACSRCAEPLEMHFDEPLELLLEPAQNPALVPEGGIALDAEDFELGRYAGDELDFGPVIQEILALAWPMQPLCAEDCAGLCPVCGAVRSRQTCECETRQTNRPFADLGRMLEESRRKPLRRK